MSESLQALEVSNGEAVMMEGYEKEEGKVKGALVESTAPMELARAMAQKVDVWCLGDEFVEWEGKKWVHRELKWVEDRAWEFLDGCVLETTGKKGEQITQRLTPNNAMVGNVVRALAAVRGKVGVVEPCLLDGRRVEWDANECVPFENGLLDVGESARKWSGEGRVPWVFRARPKSFYSSYTVPFDWDEEAKAPVWERCQMEWGGGDEVWTELRERCYGYAMLGHRKYSRMLMEYGKARGGKGTGPRTLKRLMKGKAVIVRLMTDIVESFGLEGLDKARALVVDEAEQLDKRGMERFTSLMKTMLGDGEIRVNAKWVKQFDVRAKAFPIVQSNSLLKMSDKGGGLSGKTLALPFDVSFLGREDFDLDVKLEREGPGIVRRLMEAAVRLEKESDPKKKFVMPERSAMMVAKWHLLSNPAQAFLESRFVQKVGGKVSNEMVRSARKAWERKMGMTLKREDGSAVHDNFLMGYLVERSTWPLAKTEWSADGEKVRGLVGLLMKKENADELVS